MTPLERAAQAVRDEIAYPHGDGSFVVEGGFRGDEFYREVARAVLETIREPSEAMKRAGTAVMRGVGDDKYWADAVGAYEAMIDAALAEGE